MKRKVRLFPILLIFIFLLSSCAFGSKQELPHFSPSPETEAPVTVTPSAVTPAVESTITSSPTPTEPPSPETEASAPVLPVPTDTKLQVIIFDMGQADCILIKTDEHAMLIDAGDTGQDKLILGYLSEHNVKKLDYLVATHPHADHIGSMVAVIKAVDSIGTLLMPDVIHTTQTFERLLDAIEDKDVPVAVPQPGDTLRMGSVEIQVLAPNSASYTNLNNYSIVLRIVFGQSVFLFTGDAEDISESEQLTKNFILKADVLKVGHHGSNSSSTQQYLESVSPSYAVISCGGDNAYGHPHSETLSKLTAIGVEIYRTDENGTVVFTTDGSNISVNVEREAKEEAPSAVTPDSTNDRKSDDTTTYIGNKNSKIFHLPTCGTLPAEKNRVYFITRDEAVKNDYRSCKNCKP